MVDEDVAASSTRLRGPRRVLADMAIWIFVVVGLLAPVAFVAYVFARFDDSTADSPEAIDFVPVASDEVGERLHTLNAEWEQRSVVLSPDLSGIVTGIWAAPGDVLVSLNRVISVDGIVRVGWESAEPFYRPISLEMRGEDVAELQRLLIASGHLDSEVTGHVDWSTRVAIGALSRELGFERERYDFDPNWIIRLPISQVAVGEMAVQIGSRGPSLGDELLIGPPTIRRATIVDSDGEEVALPTGMELVLDDLVLEMTNNGDIRDSDLEMLTSYFPRPSFAGGSEGATSVIVTIRRTKPVPAMRIPATAVVAGNNGSYCVWERAGSQETGPRDLNAVQITLLPEPVQPGLALIASLPEGSVIVANPAQAFGITGCR